MRLHHHESCSLVSHVFLSRPQCHTMDNQKRRRAFISYAALCLLTFQTTATVLCMRQSRVSGSPAAASGSSPGDEALDEAPAEALSEDDQVRKEPPTYLGSSLVLSSEVLKILITLVLVLVQHGLNPAKTGRTIYYEVLRKPKETYKFAIPAVLYVVQNNLVIFALTVLDAATFQVTYQVRILTTALLGRILLRKRLTTAQWTALVFLMLGVALVQIGQMKDGGSGLSLNFSLQQMAGIMAVLSAALTTATAGIYNEKLFKNGKQASLLLSNVQLSLFALVFALLGSLLNDGANIRDFGFFFKFTPIVWVIVALQAFGGLLVAVAIKYADNIMKNFATSISILLSCLFSHFFLDDLNLEPSFVFGASTVIFSTVLYASSSSGVFASSSTSRKSSSSLDSADRKSCPSYPPTAHAATSEHSKNSSQMSFSKSASAGFYCQSHYPKSVTCIYV